MFYRLILKKFHILKHIYLIQKSNFNYTNMNSTQLKIDCYAAIVLYMQTKLLFNKLRNLKSKIII